MTTALLFIDVQRDMLEGDPPVPDAPVVREALAELLGKARAVGDVLVVHVQNDGQPGEPDEPHTAGWELVFPPEPGELVLRKDQNDTFAANPDLARTLRERGVNGVVVAGMQSDYCIQASSRGALGHGFDVLLVSGAHATYDDGRASAAEISAQVERELSAEGVQVRTTSELPF